MKHESLHVVHVQYLYNTAQCVAAYQDVLPYFAVHWAWLVSQYIAVSFASFLKNIFGATVLAQDHSKLFSTKKNQHCTVHAQLAKWAQPCATQCPSLRGSLFLLGPLADNFLPSPTNEWMLRCCLSFFLPCNFTSICTVAPQIHFVGTS